MWWHWHLRHMLCTNTEKQFPKKSCCKVVWLYQLLYKLGLLVFWFSRLLPEQLHQDKQKTRTVKRSCSPTWNHTFVFTSIAHEDLQDCGLELTIWDHDRLKSHNFLGGVRINLGSCELSLMKTLSIYLSSDNSSVI